MSLCPATPPPTPCTPWDPRARGHLQGWPMCPILLICCCHQGATCHHVSSLRARPISPLKAWGHMQMVVMGTSCSRTKSEGTGGEPQPG